MVQQLILLGQVLVIVLLYVLVWRIVRTARRDLADAALGGPSGPMSTPDQSTIIPAAVARAARGTSGGLALRLVVARSEVMRPGIPFQIADGLTIGRVAGNDLVLNEPTVSSQHARVISPGTLEDLSSTNGTLVNGKAVVGRIRLSPGDHIQIGSTTLRVEAVPQ